MHQVFNGVQVASLPGECLTPFEWYTARAVRLCFLAESVVRALSMSQVWSTGRLCADRSFLRLVLSIGSPSSVLLYDHRDSYELLGTGEPRTATSTFTQLPSSELLSTRTWRSGVKLANSAKRSFLLNNTLTHLAWWVNASRYTRREVAAKWTLEAIETSVAGDPPRGVYSYVCVQLAVDRAWWDPSSGTWYCISLCPFLVAMQGVCACGGVSESRVVRYLLTLHTNDDYFEVLTMWGLLTPSDVGLAC